MHLSTYTYASTFDRVEPLLADICFVPDGKPKPVLLVIHGYSGDRKAVSQDLIELAGQGVVAISPDMRGRGGSAGVWDSGGLDVHDAVDAALAVLKLFPGETDPGNLNIVGYSGGGGIAIAAGCRFPDVFNTAVSFFGIPDYAGWRHNNTRPDCMELMTAVLGTPEDQPANYEARNMIPAAGNAARTRWWLFWDVQETMCPPSCVEEWIASLTLEGGRAQRLVSKQGDPYRWIHNYRSGNPALGRPADELFMPDVMRRPETGQLELPAVYELVVPGYLVTRHFSVTVADGRSGRVRIRYQLNQGRPQVKVIENPRNLPVTIRPESVTSMPLERK